MSRAAAAAAAAASSFSFLTKTRPFEEFFVVRKQGRQFKILLCYPDSPHQIDQKFPHVMRFCFPDRPKPRPGDPPMKALRFTFVLTNESGRRLFGHVFQPLSGDMMCFISRFCWVELFDDIFYRYRMNGESFESVVAFYNSTVPGSMGVFCTDHHHHQTQQMQQQQHQIKSSNASAAAAAAACSSPSCTPSLAEGLRRPNDSGNSFANVRLSTVLDFISTDTLLQALAAVLCENRVIVVGRRVADISDAVLFLVALLQPFDWEHVLIPVVPNDLLDVLCSPTPFLCGLLTTQVSDASRLPMEDVTVVVLGRNGGEGSFVRTGIPDTLHTHVSLVPASPTHPHAISLSKSFVVTPEMAVNWAAKSQQQQQLQSTAAGAGGGMGAAQSTAFDDTEGKLMEGTVNWGNNNNNSGNNDDDDANNNNSTTPILTLPFTESALCSLRVGLFQARRKHLAGQKEEADETLLAAFHDYYVFTFGLVFAKDFTPQNFSMRMVVRGESERDTRAFFEQVSQGMMLADMRANMIDRLEEADRLAIEIKRRHRAEMEHSYLKRVSSSTTQQGFPSVQSMSSLNNSSMTTTTAGGISSINGSSNNTSNSNNNNDDNNVEDRDEFRFIFKATPTDVYQVRRVIDSEFLEAVLERYPLLYPHAAQVLAHGTRTDEQSARTVSRLESASLLRRFASWCSYGVTSTVQKLQTQGKNLIQTRAELEEL